MEAQLNSSAVWRPRFLKGAYIHVREMLALLCLLALRSDATIGACSGSGQQLLRSCWCKCTSTCAPFSLPCTAPTLQLRGVYLGHSAPRITSVKVVPPADGGAPAGSFGVREELSLDCSFAWSSKMESE